ncbi:site-specific DNA-methyltransferase [Treponema sp.]|uniref:site-specific DNA-methyltransferase n=1 Tax=Treponema sp. TaxID=166 RepID=UPI00298DD70B|nr:site-specific DNA-methyltransferase [Treponema sp.]
MNHLKMHSLNKIDENVSKIAALFPNCVTEAKAEDGSITKKIDFDMLRQELSRSIVEGREERYQFTWPDKKQAILTANAPINKTLRPCREESVDFDNTENLYIEGDNLEVLKLLQETYLGRIKMIYIDPPYNTGNDFVYEDDFAQDAADYIANSGQTDEEGNRLVANTESNGRFHTDWLNMMYPRLKLARDLLSEDGVIFISIGQDEIENMIKLCDEVFSHDNKCGIISRLMKSGGAKGTFFSPNIEYIVVYAKNISLAKSFREPISEEIIKKLYTSIETQGERKGQKYRPFGLYQSSLEARLNQRYFIQCPDGTLVIPPGKTLPNEKIDGAGIKPDANDGCWRWSRERYIEERKKGNIEFKESKGVLIDSEGKPAKWNIYTKIWLDDRQEEGMTPVDLITKWENRQSKKELTELKIPFDFAKPTDLIKYLITISQENDAIILDFFSGSATTAHAVMQLNAEDGGNRKFIMVQLPELCDEKSEAYKAGYKNICEIGKERIRRAGQQILKQVQNDKEKSHTDSSLLTQTLFSNEEEKSLDFSNPCDNKKLDIGFRVLKCDTSNMEDVYYSPDHFDKQDLFKNNIKNDRTAEDLLFQVMLDLGIMLSSKIETKQIDGKTVYYVEGNYLVACFDEDVTEETITKIAKETPYYFVMKDSSMANDSVATNFEQIFTTYSPETIRKVL